MAIPKLKETSCTCKECVNMCKERPCWGTPEEIEKIMESGFSHRLMYDYWAGGFSEDSETDIPIIAPAIVKYEGKNAPFWPRGRCTFLNSKNRCEIYAIRPIEARVAHHDQKVGVHKEVAETWDTLEGKRVYEKWREKVGF